MSEQHQSARSRTPWWLRATRRHWCYSCDRYEWRRHVHDRLDRVLSREWRS